MNKQELISLGASEELAEKIVEKLDGNYIPKTRFNEVNTELKNHKETLKERDSQLEELKKSVGDSEKLKAQIESLQKENKAKEESHIAEIKKIKIDSAIDKALNEAKAKNLKAVKALLDMDNAELLEDGTIKGLSERIKVLAESEDSSFLFASNDGGKTTTTDKSPAKGGFVPGQKKDGVPSPSSDYESRLAEARKNGNTMEAIRIKQEAIADGVILL